MNTRTAKLLLAILVLFLMLTVINVVVHIFKNDYVTETAVAVSASNAVSFKGVYIRDEQIIEYKGKGVISYAVDDGGRLSSGETAAYVYNDEKQIRINEKIAEIDAEIAVLNKIQNPGTQEVDQPAYLAGLIENAYKNIIAYKEAGDLEKLRSEKEELVIYLSTMQYVTQEILNFSDKIAKGEQASVLVFANMSSLMYYKVMYVAGNYACIDLGREIQSERLGMVGVVGKRFDAVINAVPHEGHSLYNSKNGFSSYLLPPVLVLIIQQTLLIGIGILVGTTREENLFHRLIPLQKKYHGTLRIVLGKANAYLLLYVFIASFVLLFVPYAFNFPQLLSPSTFYAFLFPYLLACIFFGMTVSVFFRNREMPFLLLVFTSLLFLFLSGYAWPTSNIPPVWRAISMLIPSTPGVQAFLKINSMGASLKQIAPEYFTLLVQMGVYFITACLVYRWQIIRNK